MKGKYQVHAKYANREQLITTVSEKAVNLIGKQTIKKHAATSNTAEWQETIPGATQAELKQVFERGDKDRHGTKIVVFVPTSEKQ